MGQSAVLHAVLISPAVHESGLDTLPVGVLTGLHVVGVVQGVVNIGGAVIKGREQEAQRRGGNKLIHSPVVEGLFLRDVVQPALGLLHRADGAQDVGIGLVGVVLLKGIVPGLKGHVIGVIAQQNQVVSLHNHGVDDLLEEAVQQLVIPQLGFPQVHEQLMLGAARHLGGLEGDINQILADGAGQHPLKEGKILVPLVFRHNAGALAELRNDLLVVIDKAAIDFRKTNS